MTAADIVARNPERVRDLLARVMLWAIRVYRLCLSPLVGPSCRYLPSCSHYAEDALKTWGAWRGGALALWRIARCHPFSAGGVDLVPARGGSMNSGTSRLE